MWHLNSIFGWHIYSEEKGFWAAHFEGNIKIWRIGLGNALSYIRLYSSLISSNSIKMDSNKMLAKKWLPQRSF